MSCHIRRFVPILMSSAAMVASCWISAQQAQESAEQSKPTIHEDVNVLLVPVVVRDAQDRAIGDLKKEDFSVLDQGKPRTISRLTVEKPSIHSSDTNKSTEPAPAPSRGAVAQPPAALLRFVVFLFDDRHLSAADLIQTKTAASRMLDESLAGSDWASVVSTSGGGSGMTHDHTKFLSTILSLKTHLGFMADEHTCPYISYYSADQIINKNNPAEVAVAIADTIVCSHVDGHVAAEAMMTSAAQHSLSVGEEDARTSLEFVRNIVQTMAVLRGQKTLIFVSPGFLSISEPAMNLESQILNSAAAADVTISTLDARGLFNSFLGASQEVPTLAGIVTRQESHADSMRADQSVLAELADGTGGRFFHSNNDLESV